jgi:hypothetical protein
VCCLQNVARDAEAIGQKAHAPVVDRGVDRQGEKMMRTRSRPTRFAGAFVALAAAGAFVAACGDPEEVTTTGGAARAAPAVQMRPASADALEHANLNRTVVRYGSADALEQANLNRTVVRYGSADSLEQANLSGVSVVYGSADTLERLGSR